MAQMGEFSKRYRSQSDVDRSGTMHQLSLVSHQSHSLVWATNREQRDVFALWSVPTAILVPFYGYCDAECIPSGNLKTLHITHFSNRHGMLAKFGKTLDVILNLFLLLSHTLDSFILRRTTTLSAINSYRWNTIICSTICYGIKYIRINSNLYCLL